MKLRAAVVLFWVLMTALFLRYEAFPEKWAGVPHGYRAVLDRDVLVLDSWMRILFRRAPVGYSHTRVDVDDASATARYVVQNRVQMKLAMMGQPQEISADTDAWLDREQRLQRFAVSLVAGEYPVKVEGTRQEGQTFEIGVRGAGSETKFRTEIPDDAILYSPMTDLALRRMQPGERLSVRVLEPVTLTSGALTVRAVARESLRFRGRARETTVLEFDYGGMTWRAWMDESGVVLRQETPLGFVLEQCTPEEAFAALKGAKGPEILSALAVPVRGKIPDPRRCRQLTLRLSGVEWREGELSSERQSVERLGPTDVRLVIRAAQLRADGSIPTALNEAERERYLASSPWVQADHPEIRQQAEAIVRGCTSEVDRAIALCDWVHGALAKDYRATLPSALEVLRARAGDCNEHTYLFVALARAVGLPARIHVGLAYDRGAFYYHAWPAVYVGHWVEMDPTWGQHEVDAAHVALLEGEVADQLPLGRVVGRLRMAVEAADCGPRGASPATPRAGDHGTGGEAG